METQKLTTAEAIIKADSITIAHAYPDGRYLYDIGIGDKAYSVRQYPENIAQLRSKEANDH